MGRDGTLTRDAPTNPTPPATAGLHMENPTPHQIKAARKQAGLSQTAAAALIHSTLRTWQDWEYGKFPMHAGLWELFTLKTKIGSRA